MPQPRYKGGNETELKRTYSSSTVPTRKHPLLFPLMCVFLSLVLLLSGCANIFHFGKKTPSGPMGQLQQWLNKDSSFTISYQYMNLAVNGMSQSITQTQAADGSWSFHNQRKVWYHTSDYEVEESAEFYYRYEGSQLVCYSSIDGSTPQRAQLSDRDIAAMDADKALMVGVPGLLPKYMQELTITQTNEAATFSFRLPVEKVLADNTYLSAFVSNVFTLSGSAYKPEYNATILCTFETEPQTFQPRSLYYDFSQIKPYVLSEGALSGETALDSDFLTMTYTFDYALPATTQIPDYMFP